MANDNVPAPDPIRSDDQILPFAAWDALEITFVDQAHQFVSPHSGDAIMDSVNQLGYPGEIHFVSRMSGIITRTNIDYAELMWEEFVQAIQTFLVDKANLGSPTKKDKKTKPHVIPYSRFTKLIIYHLGRHNNIHQMPGSPLNLAEDDLSLGNIKFVPKGETNEVFGMKILEELITNNIKNAPYYNIYLEMVAKHEQGIAASKEGGKKKTTPKADRPLIDELDEEQDQPKVIHEPQGAGEEYDLERAIQMSLESFQAQGQAYVSGVAIREPVEEATRPLPARRTPATEESSTGPSAQTQDDTSANIVRETPSPADAEIGADTDKVISKGDKEILNIGEEQGEDVDNQGDLEEQTVVLDEGQAGSNPGKTHESRLPPDDDKIDEDQARLDPRKSHVALAGPNPKPMHDNFVATVYPKVHESLKFLVDEQVILEDPPSSSGALSSMKNLDDTYTFGDQFFNDKSTADEPGKQNVDAKVVSLVTVPIHQASTSVPSLSTPIIDLPPPKLVASPFPESYTAKSKTLDNETQNLRSRVFSLELRDLPHKINQTVTKVVKEAVYIALQALLRERFRELLEADMKEILHQRMLKISSYKSLSEYVALYEALEESMERANKEEFLAEKDMSRKIRHDNQDPPPPPPPDSDLSKKKRHDSNTLRSKHPPSS
nr:hypothetical protein [Tanacetum cinerariifolium]